MSNVNFPLSDPGHEYLQFSSGENRDQFKPLKVNLSAQLPINPLTDGVSFPWVFGPKRVVPISPNTSESPANNELSFDSLVTLLSYLFERGEFNKVRELTDKILAPESPYQEDTKLMAQNYIEKIESAEYEINPLRSKEVHYKKKSKDSLLDVSSKCTLLLLKYPNNPELIKIHNSVTEKLKNLHLKELCKRS